MKKTASLVPLLIAFVLFLFIACQKEHTDTSKEKKPPIAHAGNDTTIYSPFTSSGLNGTATTDLDSNIMSYQWKILAGPSPVIIGSGTQVKAYALGLMQLGDYIFELTVRDADNQITRDTVKITAAEPNCTGVNKEVILNKQYWEYDWDISLLVDNFLQYLPPNSYLKSIYLRRKATANWEYIAPLDYTATTSRQVHEWIFDGATLGIFVIGEIPDDALGIKIEYCN